MLDPRLLRERPEVVAAGIRARAASVPPDELRGPTHRRRGLARRSRSSEGAAEPGVRGRSPPPSAAAATRPPRSRSRRRVGEEISALEAELRTPRRRSGSSALRFPNVPHPSGPGRRLRGRQRRGAPLGRAPGLRVRAPPPLGARRAPGDPRLRAGRPARQGPLHGAVGARRAARARARPVHAGRPHEAARLPGGLGPAPRERGDDARDGPAPEVRGGAVQDRRAGGRPPALPDPDRRGAADGPPRGRDPGRRDAAAEVHGLHAVLPAGGRLLREGHAGHDPPAPVRQGRAGEARRRRRRPTTSSRP